jgi:hypothetical protein
MSLTAHADRKTGPVGSVLVVRAAFISPMDEDCVPTSHSQDFLGGATRQRCSVLKTRDDALIEVGHSRFDHGQTPTYGRRGTLEESAA